MGDLEMGGGADNEQNADNDEFNGGTMLMGADDENDEDDAFDGGTMMIQGDMDVFDDSTMLFDESMTNEIDANSQYAQYMKQKKAEDKNKKIIKEQQQKQAQSFKIILKKQKAKKSFNSY